MRQREDTIATIAINDLLDRSLECTGLLPNNAAGMVRNVAKRELGMKVKLVHVDGGHCFVRRIYKP